MAFHAVTAAIIGCCGAGVHSVDTLSTRRCYQRTIISTASCDDLMTGQTGVVDLWIAGADWWNGTCSSLGQQMATVTVAVRIGHQILMV